FDGGFEGVVHLAAVTSVLRSMEHPELTFKTNVEGTHALLEAARPAGVTSLAFASTNAVTGPMEAPAITEAATLRPLTPYGATKAAGEMLMSAYTASYGVRCAVLRLTNVYGPGMQAKDSIVARLMRAIRLGRTFEIYGDGTQVCDYVEAADVPAAVRLGLASPEWSGAVVSGCGRSLTACAADHTHAPPRILLTASAIVHGERLREIFHNLPLPCAAPHRQRGLSLVPLPAEPAGQPEIGKDGDMIGVMVGEKYAVDV